MARFSKTTHYILVVFIIGILLSSCTKDNLRYPPDINITLSIDIPEMSETLFAKVHNNNHPVRIGIYLPENYSNTKKYPLILWLNGGDGARVIM